jgi:ribosomal protein S18 acetylase RimI-like enzyme
MRDFEILDRNLRAALSVFALAKDSGAAREGCGLAMMASSVKFAMFNGGVISSPVGDTADLDSRLCCAADYFDAHALPWSFWVCHDWLPRDMREKSDHVFVRRGLRPIIDLPAMMVDPLLPPATPCPALEYREVCDLATRTTFTHILSICFGIPLAICREIYESESFWNGAMRGYVGFLDGNPVSTAATVVAAGVIGVYSVATLPSYERRGYGEAVTRHAIERAREESGCERCVLQSSPEGFGLYERMGFRQVTRYSVYATL